MSKTAPHDAEELMQRTDRCIPRVDFLSTDIRSSVKARLEIFQTALNSPQECIGAVAWRGPPGHVGYPVRYWVRRQNREV